jgi:hypothetical protein
MKARSKSKRRRPRVIPVARPAFSPALRPLFPWAWPVGVVPDDAVLRVPLPLPTVVVAEVLNGMLNGTQLIKPARVAESKSPGEVQDTRTQGPIAARMAAEIEGLHWQVVLVGEQLLNESAEVRHGT